jgi:hypothetical protein
MSAKENGGPAFPQQTNTRREVDGFIVREREEGMSLRDYFAIHAPEVPDDFGWAEGEACTWDRCVRWNYFYADIMLLKRKS